MTIEWLGPRGFRRCNVSRDLHSAQLEFASRATYVEYWDKGKLLGTTLHKSVNPVLEIMHAIRLRREKI